MKSHEKLFLDLLGSAILEDLLDFVLEAAWYQLWKLFGGLPMQSSIMLKRNWNKTITSIVWNNSRVEIYLFTCERVAKYQTGNSRTSSRHFCKFLSQESSESSSQDVNSLETEVIQKLKKTLTPGFVCPIDWPLNRYYPVSSTW